MSGNFLDKIKKLAEDFEKKAVPKIEKAVDDCAKKATELSDKLARDVEDKTNKARQTGEQIKGRVRRDWEALSGKDTPKPWLQPQDQVKKPYVPAPGAGIPPKGVRYDAKAAVIDVTAKLQRKDYDGAEKKTAYLCNEIKARRADVRDIDMVPLIDYSNSQYENGTIKSRQAASGCARKLIAHGADISMVDPAPLRQLARKQLSQQQHGKVSATIEWARYLEQAVADCQKMRRAEAENSAAAATKKPDPNKPWGPGLGF